MRSPGAGRSCSCRGRTANAILIDKLHHAIQVVSRHGDRRLRFEVPIAVTVEYLRTRYFKLVAQAEVDRQFTVDLPIVLDKETPIPGPGEGLGIDVVVGAVPPADQHGRETVALDARSDVGVLAGGAGAEAELA